MMEMDKQQKRARALLQALAFHDIDIVSEYRDHPFSALAPPPNSDEVGTTPNRVLIAHQCSACRRLVRSYHFYECAKGCKDDANEQRNEFKKIKPSSGAAKAAAQEAEVKKKHLSPFRLCPACLSGTNHDLKHLRAVRAFPKTDPESRRFTRELNAWEDRNKMSKLRGIAAGQRVAGFIYSLFERDSGTPMEKIFPDGNTHSSLMIGPLLIEIGATGNDGGALLSLRSPPNLGVDSPEEMEMLVADDRFNDWAEGVLISREYLLSEDRKLYERKEPRRQRRFLRAEKQIAGGLFTSHLGNVEGKSIDKENSIVDRFLHFTSKWRAQRGRRFRNEKRRGLMLMGWAREIRDMISADFGHLITPYFECFAHRLLDKNIKLDFHSRTNNCQRFTNELIFQTPSDPYQLLFEGHYPFVMPWRRRRSSGADGRLLPAYLMSFAKTSPHGIVNKANRGFVALRKLQSPNQLHACIPHNAADTIDHAASVFYKTDQSGAPAWPSSICHDDILLKASQTTCSEGRDGHCTFADHLLDCPFDSLCVPTLHVHRHTRYYTTPTAPDEEPGERPLTLPSDSKTWMANRLRVLHRIFALNAFLAQTARLFDVLSQKYLTPELANSSPADSVDLIFEDHWSLGSGALLGRAWHYQLRTRDSKGNVVQVPFPKSTLPEWDRLTRSQRNRAWEISIVRGELIQYSADTGRRLWRRLRGGEGGGDNKGKGGLPSEEAEEEGDADGNREETEPDGVNPDRN